MTSLLFFALACVIDEMHTTVVTAELPVPYAIETLAGLDQPTACGDLDFVIESGDPQEDGSDLGGLLSAHVGGSPLVTLGEAELAPGAVGTVFLDGVQFPLTLSWIEGNGRRAASTCPSGAVTDADVFPLTEGEAAVALVPTTVAASELTDDCDVVTAIAFVHGPLARFDDPSGAVRLLEQFTTVGVPVPCHW